MSVLVFLRLAEGLRRWAALPLIAIEEKMIRLNCVSVTTVEILLTAHVVRVLESLEDCGVH